MAMFNKEPNTSLFIGGERTSGQEVRNQNGKLTITHNFFSYIRFLVLAAVSIANVVKSSLGPVGLDKMMVDDIGVIY